VSPNFNRQGRIRAIVNELFGNGDSEVFRLIEPNDRCGGGRRDDNVLVAENIPEKLGHYEYTSEPYSQY